MAMTAGSVTVDDDGTVTKSGMAEAIYDQFVNNYQADNGTPIPAPPPPENTASMVAIKRGFANTATHMAVAIVGYITANAKARIYAATGGLQRSTDPGELTDPNGFDDKDLPIV